MKRHKGSAGGGRRIVYGIGPVSELLKASRQPVTAVLLSVGRTGKGGAERGGRPDGVAAIEHAARSQGIRIEHVAPAELDAMCGPNAVHQGVVATTGPYRYVALEDLLADVDGGEVAPVLVALDGVTDPHNLGAIARSAYLLGAAGLIVPRDRAAEVTAVATKASAGATEHLAISQVTNLARAMGEIKSAGLWNAGLAAGADARPLAEIDAQLPLCLVVGSEGRGLRQLVARQCDFQFEIPMARGAVGSFNVSVAAAIALYEVARRR